MAFIPMRNYNYSAVAPSRSSQSLSGGGLADIWNAVSPHLMNIGKEIISNPKVQESAKALAQKGVEEVINSVKSRIQKGGCVMEQPKRQRKQKKGKQLSPSAQAKLKQLMSGRGLKIIQ